MKKYLLGLALLSASFTYAFAGNQTNDNAAKQITVTDAMIKADGDLNPKKCDDQKLKNSGCQSTCMTFQQCAAQCASQHDPSNSVDEQAYNDCKDKNCKDRAMDIATCVLKSKGLNIDVKSLTNMKK